MVATLALLNAVPILNKSSQILPRRLIRAWIHRSVSYRLVHSWVHVGCRHEIRRLLRLVFEFEGKYLPLSRLPQLAPIHLHLLAEPLSHGVEVILRRSLNYRLWELHILTCPR